MEDSLNKLRIVCSGRFRCNQFWNFFTDSVNYILITNLMHWLLFIH